MNTVTFCFKKVNKKKFMQLIKDSMMSKITLMEGKLECAETARSIFARNHFPELNPVPGYESFFNVEMIIICKMNVNCKTFFMEMVKKNKRKKL